jgi:hypothetical protein
MDAPGTTLTSLVLAPLPHAVCVRGFGVDGCDLDIDLGDVLRPRALTRVLNACLRDGQGQALGEEHWWHAPIGTRLQALLAVIACADSRPFDVVHACDKCGEQLEMELALPALIEFHGQRAELESVALRVDDREIVLRRPTGDDQRRWVSAPTKQRQLVLDLVPANQRAFVANLDSAAWERIDEAMATADPLIDFHAETACPACSVSHRIAIDLESLAWARLANAQRALVDDVLRLASAYYWTERDILALSPARRALYLERLGS